MIRQKTTTVQPETTAPPPEFSIVLMGNPGAGKSAILNALGGDFFSGFRRVTGHPGTKTDIVELRNRTVALIDTPGIMDSGREGTISQNLQMLQDKLNGCGEALLAGDFSVLKLLLTNLTRTPRIGLFVTKVASDDMEQLDTAYRDDFVKMLQEADVDATHLEKSSWCVLQHHERTVGFSDEEKEKIRDYVTSFAPARVEVKELSLSFFQKILEFFRKLFS
ncbi:hypothetical protein BGZ95_004550 [Linnemannia exigua]|uniref:G domain-containing protein n=1 Tax=Linnemannia exigua TaxID=604196 RepID=A0AAD4H9B2_9FUNG|nr:hypothetical protein BGZ95_004550 [Linnemannia exigua]